MTDRGICPATGGPPAKWVPWPVGDRQTVCQLHAWGRTVGLDRAGRIKPHVPSRPYPLVALLLPEFADGDGDYDISHAATLWDYAEHRWLGDAETGQDSRVNPAP